MSAKEAFVLRALQEGANRADLCREFGISRKTGYKWIRRYEETGLAGLEDVTRKPHSSPLEIPGELVAEIVGIRQAHPRWGAKKIAAILRQEHSGLETPSTRTVHRVLVRTGFLQPIRKRKRINPNRPRARPRMTAKVCNDVWTVDFKGWWLSIDKKRCEPLTVRDAYSRFILDIQVLPSTKHQSVRAAFTRIFTKYGLPKAILTDNGPPFVVNHGTLGFSRLTTWWLSLGINHLRTRPGRPSDNGGHERMHRDMAEEVESLARLKKHSEQQQACERFRHDFNCHRPHEALSMKRPADIYKASEVRFVDKPTEYEYPDEFHVRKVAKNGCVGFKGRSVSISWCMAEYDVGFEPIGINDYAIWFYHRKIGEVTLTGNNRSYLTVRRSNLKEVLPISAQ